MWAFSEVIFKAYMDVWNYGIGIDFAFNERCFVKVYCSVDVSICDMNKTKPTAFSSVSDIAGYCSQNPVCCWPREW